MGHRHRETLFPVAAETLYATVVSYLRGKPDFYTAIVADGSHIVGARLMRNRLLYSSRVRFEIMAQGDRSQLVIDLQTHPLFLDLLGFWERYLDRVTDNLQAELA